MFTFKFTASRHGLILAKCFDKKNPVEEDDFDDNSFPLVTDSKNK